MIKKLLKFIYPLLPNSKLRSIILRFCGYTIGMNVYLSSTFKISDLKSRKNNVIIGNRVSFGPSVLIITDSSPNNSKLFKLFPLESKDVLIDDDAWIGANVSILPGVTIGKCSVVGTGSVVTESIPAYSIAVGVPAKVIKKINPDEL